MFKHRCASPHPPPGTFRRNFSEAATGGARFGDHQKPQCLQQSGEVSTPGRKLPKTEAQTTSHPMMTNTF